MANLDELIRSLPREVKQQLLARGLAAAQDERRALAATPVGSSSTVDEDGSRLVRLTGARGSALTYRLSRDDLAL